MTNLIQRMPVCLHVCMFCVPFELCDRRCFRRCRRCLGDELGGLHPGVHQEHSGVHQDAIEASHHAASHPITLSPPPLVWFGRGCATFVFLQLLSFVVRMTTHVSCTLLVSVAWRRSLCSSMSQGKDLRAPLSASACAGFSKGSNLDICTHWTLQ